MYRKTSNISRPLVGNKIVDNSDVVGASPVGAAPTTSSFSSYHLASRDWAKTTARGDRKPLSLGIWCDLYWRFYGRFQFLYQLGSTGALWLETFQWGSHWGETIHHYDREISSGWSKIWHRSTICPPSQWDEHISILIGVVAILSDSSLSILRQKILAGLCLNSTTFIKIGPLPWLMNHYSLCERNYNLCKEYFRSASF